MIFTGQDFFTIGVLILLEGILSIDNALVLAVLARSLPVKDQRRALSYGLLGAILFRVSVIGLATYLMKWVWVKFIGGGYLLFVGLSHLLKPVSEEAHLEKQKKKKRSFWMTVLIIELTDIAFALDSILAAVALTPKYWLIVIGGTIGLIMMRFSAALFIKLLERFPSFERTAYILVTWIGLKVVIEGFQIEAIDFHSTSNPAFWIFWGTILLSVLTGFKSPTK